MCLCSLLARVCNEAFHHAQTGPSRLLERIVSKMREFVEADGTRLIVGLQVSDDRLIQHLQAERVAFVAFDGAETCSALYGAHWTPDGHKPVAERLLERLSENNVAKMDGVSR